MVEELPDLENCSLLDFYRRDSTDILEKCHYFYQSVHHAKQKNLIDSMYRVTLTSSLDHRITVLNPHTLQQDQKICFDSNSYLGLHRHPRVIAAVTDALKTVGYGTPSAQLLCGTNRYLRELEEIVSEFHGREDTLIFPSGYSANIGAITALVRKKDAVFRDRFSHASIHDGCKALDTAYNYVYPSSDMQKLSAQLNLYSMKPNAKGKLILTDGLFSMHGHLADLPKLAELAKQYRATLMVDEAHSVGVIGDSGRGLEDHYKMPGVIDVLMGTFSKAPGTSGGYISGSKALIHYLRYFANAGVFTATLPAATCAGITQAYKIMMEEPEHRSALWENIHIFAPALKASGFNVSQPHSPIITVFMGSTRLLWMFSQALYQAGIKCGNVSYPAVPQNEAILRFAVNARHTREDLSQCIAVMTMLGKKFDILHKTPQEIQEMFT